ncbi:hypothetical protein CDAR_558711, partial [Caerostris darwini]
MSDDNETSMDVNPPVKDQNLTEIPQNINTGVRRTSPSRVNVSEDFLYDNMELITKLHTFQSQLEHLHNCMQAATNKNQDPELTAQTNALVLK